MLLLLLLLLLLQHELANCQHLEACLQPPHVRRQQQPCQLPHAWHLTAAQHGHRAWGQRLQLQHHMLLLPWRQRARWRAHGDAQAAPAV
jgi:hypothetical protein